MTIEDQIIGAILDVQHRFGVGSPEPVLPEPRKTTRPSVTVDVKHPPVANPPGGFDGRVGNIDPQGRVHFTGLVHNGEFHQTISSIPFHEHAEEGGELVDGSPTGLRAVIRITYDSTVVSAKVVDIQMRYTVVGCNVGN